MAGSEVKDLEPLLPDIKSKTGVTLVLSYSGTLEGAEAIAGGAPTDVGLVQQRQLPVAAARRPAAGSWPSRRSCSARSSSGVKKSVADRFGWTDNPNVTWKDIEAKSADGSFRFAMTNPAASNSGLVALIGVASALSGSSDSIDTGHDRQDRAAGLLQGPGADRRQLRVPRRRLRPRAGQRRRHRQLRVDPDEPQRGRQAPRAARPDLSRRKGSSPRTTRSCCSTPTSARPTTRSRRTCGRRTSRSGS